MPDYKIEYQVVIKGNVVLKNMDCKSDALDYFNQHMPIQILLDQETFSEEDWEVSAEEIEE